MTSIFDCGFSRSAVKEAYKLHRAGDASTMTSRRKEYYDKQFIDCDNSFKMDSYSWKRRSQALASKLFSWKDVTTKEQYFSSFSMTAWEAMPVEEKRKHNRENCVECETNNCELQELFDVKCNKIKSKQILKETTNTSTPKLTRKRKRNSNIHKVAKYQMQAIEKEFKKKCEDVMSRDGKDLNNLLANRQSYRGYDRDRKDRLLEPYEEAKKRVTKPRRVNWRLYNIDVDSLLNRVKQVEEVCDALL